MEADMRAPKRQPARVLAIEGHDLPGEFSVK
jgi:hypothetical protein